MSRPRQLSAIGVACVALLVFGLSAHASGDGSLDVDTVRANASHAASMLTDSPRPAAWAAALDAIESGAVGDPATRLAEIDAEVDAVLSAIVAPEPFTFTLTGGFEHLAPADPQHQRRTAARSRSRALAEIVTRGTVPGSPRSSAQLGRSQRPGGGPVRGGRSPSRSTSSPRTGNSLARRWSSKDGSPT